MNVSITFRHMEPTEALKAHAFEKVSRLQKFLRQPMTARVTLSFERNEHSVEVQVQSGGQWYEAKDASADTYASIDAATAKLDHQIRSSKGAVTSRRRRGPDLRHSVPEDEVPVAMASGDR